MSTSKENGRVAAREPNHGSPTAEAVRFLIGRVADRAMTYRYYHWDWGEAIAMEGLWRAAELTRTERYRAFVDHMLHGWIAHSPDPWYPDHVGPGRVLVEMGHAAGNTRFLSYARLLATHLVNLPRSRLGAVFHRPDLPDRAQMVWVDSLQTDAPFLCRLAVAIEDGRWFDSAAQHVLGQINALQDPAAHLFHHHYNEEAGRRNGIFWARGNGWALLGLTQCLELLPRAHPEYPAIARSLEALASAVVRYQDPTSSLWHTVIDNPETYLEGSASLMLSCCLMRAGRAGLLPLPLAEAGSRAWARLWAAVDARGVVHRVSSRTPPRSDAAAYNQRPLGGNYPWGQGAYLLAATTFLGS